MRSMNGKGDGMCRHMIRNTVLCLCLFQGIVMAEDCLTKSYKSAIGVTKERIEDERKEDLNYSSCAGLMCCCSSQIKGLFKEKTKDMTHKRVNPAVDKLIEALRNQRQASDIKIEELVHLKYVNALYSFYDENGTEMKKEKLTMPDSNEDGCEKEIIFRKLEAKDLIRTDVYRQGILKEVLALLHAWEKSEKMIVEKNMIKIVK